VALKRAVLNFIMMAIFIGYYVTNWVKL